MPLILTGQDHSRRNRKIEVQMPGMPSVLLIVAVALVVFGFLHSIRRIGPTEVGLVTKRFS